MEIWIEQKYDSTEHDFFERFVGQSLPILCVHEKTLARDSKNINISSFIIKKEGGGWCNLTLSYSFLIDKSSQAKNLELCDSYCTYYTPRRGKNHGGRYFLLSL